MTGQAGRPWLILQPYGGHLEVAIHPTSRVLKAECGHYCWISPQGEPYLARGMKPMCLTCVDEAYGPDVQRESFMVEGTLDVVRQFEGEAGVQRGLAFMRERGITREVGPEGPEDDPRHERRD